MKFILLTTLFLFSTDGYTNDQCPGIEVPKSKLSNELYIIYKNKELNLDRFPAWKGEDFYALTSNQYETYLFAISEVFWGQSCRVTRKLYVYDLNKILIGFYGGLSSVPAHEELSIIKPTQPFYFDGEHYVWQAL